MMNFSLTRAHALSLVTACLISACQPAGTTGATLESAPATATEEAATPAVAQKSAVSEADLETAALLFAKAFDSAKGEYTGAFRRVGARSEGSTVIIESRITRTYAYVEPSRARRQLRASVCEDDFTKSFVDAGGAFRFVFFRRSRGGSGEAVTISSC